MPRIRLDRQYVQWLKATAREARQNPDVGGNRDLQSRVVETLQQVNPKMAEKLRQMNLLKAFGVALEYKMWQRADELEAQGYGPDAKTEAMKEWFDMEPDTYDPIASEPPALP